MTTEYTEYTEETSDQRQRSVYSVYSVVENASEHRTTEKHKLVSQALPLTWILLLLFSVVQSNSAQTTAFTYQGRLVSDGSPATGTFDFQFSLFDSPTSGTQVGGPVTAVPITVSNGLFTTTIDFGVSPFDGSPRWLQIAVRTNGSAAAHTTLAPRQSINSTPYAVRSFQAETVASTGLPTGTTVVSSDPQDPLLTSAGLQRFMTVPSRNWSTDLSPSAPSGRTDHSAVWSGQELYIWGGDVGSVFAVNTGSAYSPTSESWNLISSVDAPTARSKHAAVWTGQHMIIWGGFSSGGYVNTGGTYDPANRRWTPTTTDTVPDGRVEHVTAWTGTHMIIWGGRNGSGLLNSGALYDPASDQWSSLSVSNPPDERGNATALWTGDQLLVWGGVGNNGELSSGGRLTFSGSNPSQWLPISNVNAPSARTGHTTIWTGSRLIVWGGIRLGVPLGDGGIYDPATDIWQPLPAMTNSPSARSGHVAVWTGTEMLIWSGRSASGELANGAAYNPTTAQWRPLTNGGGPFARSEATAAWTGQELVVFGGRNGPQLVHALQKVNPQPEWYFYRKP